MKRRDVLKAALGLTIVTACRQPTPTPTTAPTPASQPAAAQTPRSPFRVAFIYPSPVGDVGWSWAHDQGRQEVERRFPDVQTAYKENVPENPADAERVIRDFARQGYNLIVTCSFGYMDPTIRVAQEFPKPFLSTFLATRPPQMSARLSERLKSRAMSPDSWLAR